MNFCHRCGRVIKYHCPDCEPEVYAKYCGMEFKVRTFAYKSDRCDRRSCGEGSTIAFPITPTEHIWLCEEHGKHLKALVEGQDKPTRNSRNSLFKELKALCDRYEPVEYCQECGNVKESK